MSVHGRRSISPRDSPTAESPTSSEASTIASPDCTPGGQVILFESYLYKIPPLKKSILMVSWLQVKLHWCTFQCSIQLCHLCTDQISPLTSISSLLTEMVKEMVLTKADRYGEYINQIHYSH